MKLNYKASNVAKAEKESGLNFFNSMSNLGNGSIPSMSILLFLCQAGGASEDEFDEAMKAGVEKVMATIMEELADSGFLGSTIDKKKVKELIEKATQEVKATTSTEASDASGKASK